MWTFDTRRLSARPATLRATVRQGTHALSVRELIEAWRDDPAFCRFWTASLAGIPYAAYHWEAPPLCVQGLDERFECVFVDSPELATVRADATPFAAHFRPGVAAPAVFENLGRDAWLVAPPPAAGQDYPHLARFVRSAPPEQARAFWRTVADTLSARIGETPQWLSTAGLGVYWLHVRIDRRPKYFRHRPYAAPPGRAHD